MDGRQGQTYYVDKGNDGSVLERLVIRGESVLHSIPVHPEVWYMVGMDLIGPLKKTKDGDQYILTMTDYFSKYVETVALPDKQASTVARGIFQIYCRQGAPVRIVSDQGREFINEVRGQAYSMWCKTNFTQFTYLHAPILAK